MKRYILTGLFLAMIVSQSGFNACADTLSDLGTNAVPGEIPKWDGTQWRNAHDNGTTVYAGTGLSGTMTNGEITLGVVFNTNGTSNVVSRADHTHDDLSVTRPPIGAVVAWMKNYTNTPTNMLAGWVECNGQTLSDTDSVYNGQTIPNLNGASAGTQRYLRGSTTSGATGGSENHSHSGTTGWSGGNASGTATHGTGGLMHQHSFNTDASSTLPSYYEVVWIMRIK